MVEVQVLVYLLYCLEPANCIHMCLGGICECSRVSLSNEDDYAALGGGAEKPQGGRGEENMCL